MSDNIAVRVRAWLSPKHMYTWLAVIGLCGVLLIGVSSCREEATTEQPTTVDTATYIAQLEQRLERMVSSIEGAGRAQVMVTLHNGVEYVYANEEKSNSDHTESESQVSVRDDNQTTVVTVDAANGKSGLLVTEIQPVVRGVVVACEGGANDRVSALVNQAVRTALDITEKRVCVIPYNSEKEQ